MGLSWGLSPKFFLEEVHACEGRGGDVPLSGARRLVRRLHPPGPKRRGDVPSRTPRPPRPLAHFRKAVANANLRRSPLRDESEFAIISTCAPPGELALAASHSIGGDSCFEERHAKEAEATAFLGDVALRMVAPPSASRITVEGARQNSA